jgi:hypothetical protein
MTDRFEMSMMGELKFFLRFQIKQLEDETFLSQTKCGILAQGLIGLIEYLYHKDIPSFLKAHLQRTTRLSVLGPEQF